MPKMGPGKRRGGGGRGLSSSFNALAADPTSSDFLNPRTSLISNAFDGDDHAGSHPTVLPSPWSGR